jgi:hypothetical protein
MDCWICGLMGLNSRKAKDEGLQENFKREIWVFSRVVFFYIILCFATIQ